MIKLKNNLTKRVKVTLKWYQFPHLHHDPAVQAPVLAQLHTQEPRQMGRRKPWATLQAGSTVEKKMFWKRSLWSHVVTKHGWEAGAWRADEQSLMTSDMWAGSCGPYTVRRLPNPFLILTQTECVCGDIRQKLRGKSLTKDDQSSFVGSFYWKTSLWAAFLAAVVGAKWVPFKDYD